MRVPVALVDAFRNDFEKILTDFLVKNQMIDGADALHSKRFMSRSVAPHVKSLSDMFNRKEGTQTDAIDTETYWTEGGSPKNRRLGYFLSFMPCNLFRVSAVWSELHRLGFKWPFPADQDFKGLEFGAGVASGACGIVAGECYAPLGLPKRGNFALIEQSKAALQLGTKWLENYSEAVGNGLSVRPFHRRMDLNDSWLPKAAPKFHLFVMSYFLNETEIAPEALVSEFINTCLNHLEDEGLVIIVEPALKLQSRKLLDFRRALIANSRVQSGEAGLKVLLPCLGHQACGALAKEDDWCHEEVSWWRPSYLRELDSMVGLDRKSLPFSYLVIQKTRRELNEILPELKGKTEERYRLVSPSHNLSKRTTEFFMCGQDGKRRTRFVVENSAKKEAPDRGDILQHVALHGEPESTQIDRGEVLKTASDLETVQHNDEFDSEFQGELDAAAHDSVSDTDDGTDSDAE